jgi:hypothetical protein
MYSTTIRNTILTKKEYDDFIKGKYYICGEIFTLIEKDIINKELEQIAKENDLSKDQIEQIRKDIDQVCYLKHFNINDYEYIGSDMLYFLTFEEWKEIKRLGGLEIYNNITEQKIDNQKFYIFTQVISCYD